MGWPMMLIAGGAFLVALFYLFSGIPGIALMIVVPAALVAWGGYKNLMRNGRGSRRILG